jgi:hypothetical protein
LSAEYWLQWFKTQKEKKDSRLLLPKTSTGDKSVVKSVEGSGKKKNSKGNALSELVVVIVGKKCKVFGHTHSMFDAVTF